MTADYSYFRFNPTLSSYFNSQNLNGGGGDITFFFSRYVGIKADLQGYNSFTQCTKSGAPVNGCASGNLSTYMFGPEFKYHGEGRFEPFGEVLVGGAYSNFYANACKNGICGSASPNNNAFSFAAGGGVDIRATSRISLRPVDADYVLTNFANHLNGGSSTQSNFRFTTGIQFRF